MSGVNKAIIVGRLGKDPEHKILGSGAAVCNFSVATSQKVKDEEVTEWHNIVTFNKLADVCGEHLSKGRQVYLEGRIQTDKWEDKDGNTRYTTKIIANNVQFLTPKNNGGEKAGGF